MRPVLVLALLLGAVPLARAGSVGVGDRAPGFTLESLAGSPVSLATLRGRAVCLDFWASWCAGCRTALPAFDALARTRPDVVFLAVTIDRSVAAAEAFLAEHLPAPTATLLHDPSAAVLARYGADGMPALYVIDEEGTVRFVESGNQPGAAARLAAALDAMRTVQDGASTDTPMSGHQ